MSRNKRRFAPQKRAFNEKMVERPETDWMLGLSTDTIRTPSRGVEELENARSHKSEIRGRTGTLMHNRADYQVTPLATEDYPTAIAPGGSIFIAKGSAPVDGEIFIIDKPEDYSDSTLTFAKKDVLNSGRFIAPVFEEDYARPWTYDFFEVLGGVKPIYLGNLAVAEFRTYIARIRNGLGLMTMEVTKVGNTLTRTVSESDPFVQEIAGMYIVYGEPSPFGTFSGKRDFITTVLDADTLVVSKADTIADGSYVFNTIQPKIHASYYHQAQKALYIHAGEEIYETPIPIFKWTKLIGIYDKKPFPADSLFHEVKGDLILTNANGHYRINIDQRDTANDPCYWKINTNEPDKSANKTVVVFGFPTSQGSVTDENPFVSGGFSGEYANGDTNRIGGLLL